MSHRTGNWISQDCSAIINLATSTAHRWMFAKPINCPRGQMHWFTIPRRPIGALPCFPFCICLLYALFEKQGNVVATGRCLCDPRAGCLVHECCATATACLIYFTELFLVYRLSFCRRLFTALHCVHPHRPPPPHTCVRQLHSKHTSAQHLPFRLNIV